MRRLRRSATTSAVTTLALSVVIVASVPRHLIDDVVPKLEAAAKAAGCAETTKAMRYPDAQGRMEVIVRCKEEAK